jgi:hypothetical protein
MTGFSMNIPNANRAFNLTDGVKNPYNPQACNKDGVLSAAEIGARLVNMQNGDTQGYGPGPRGQENFMKEGSLWQTIMSGNGGEGYYDMISQLDGQAGISKQEMAYLSGLDGNNRDITDKDFLALKSMNQGQQPAQNTGNINDLINQLMSNMPQQAPQATATATAGPNGASASAQAGAPAQMQQPQFAPQQQYQQPQQQYQRPQQHAQQQQQGMMQMFMQMMMQMFGMMMQMMQMFMGGGQQQQQPQMPFMQ